MVFTIPTTGLGAAVADSVTSLSPLFTIAAGLVIAGAALGWGISMIKKWRGAK
jgi:nitrate/nitrite transporter NarK